MYDYINDIVKQVNLVLTTCEGFECDIKDNFLFASLKYQILFNKKTFVHVLEGNETVNKDMYKDVWFDSVGEGKGKEWTIQNIIKPLCQIMKAHLSGPESTINT